MEILERIEQIVKNTEKNEIIFYEFGVCDGHHTAILLNILQNSKKKYKYFGFEPVVSLHPKIRINSKNNPNFILSDKAIAATSDEVVFYESGGYKVENGNIIDHYYGSSSIRRPVLCNKFWPDMVFNETKIKTTTFDENIILHNIQNEIIDFVWADIQGAEVDLINGGKNAFKNVKYFYTEYVNYEMYGLDKGGDGLYDGEIGLEMILEMLPDFEIVENYGCDVLLKNKNL